MARVFESWLDGFRASINSYQYYADFDKVYENVEGIKVELNILNSLVGSRHIEEEFESLCLRYPEIIKCIPILLAVREKEIFAMDTEGEHVYSFKKDGDTIENYKIFMRKTGLFDLLQNRIIDNLVDYVTGVEVGLGSNSRKNRGGHQMEDLVESFIRKAGFIKDETYFKEMYLDDIERRWRIDLSAISNDGKTKKRFDFVVKTDKTIYAFETNFYTGGGSKLNETARSYKLLAQESANIDGFTFVWVTDGAGWISAKGNLRETFDETKYIYSIIELEEGVLDKLLV